MLEHLRRDICRLAGRGISQSSRLGARKGKQLLDARGGNGWTRHKRELDVRGLRHMNEVLEGIIWKSLSRVRQYRYRRRASEQDRVPVRGRLGYDFSSDNCVSARPVLDNHRLIEMLA